METKHQSHEEIATLIIHAMILMLDKDFEPVKKHALKGCLSCKISEEVLCDIKQYLNDYMAFRYKRQ